MSANHHLRATRRKSRSGVLTPPSDYNTPPLRAEGDNTWNPPYGIAFTEAKDGPSRRGETAGPGNSSNESGVNADISTGERDNKFQDGFVNSSVSNLALSLTSKTSPRGTSAADTKRIKPGWRPYVPVHRRQERALSTGVQSNEQLSGFTISDGTNLNDAPRAASFSQRPSTPGTNLSTGITPPPPRASDKDFSGLHFTSDVTPPINTTIEQSGTTLKDKLRPAESTRQPKIHSTPPHSPPTPNNITSRTPVCASTPEADNLATGGVTLLPRPETVTHTPPTATKSVVTETVVTQVSIDSTIVNQKDNQKRKSKWAKEPSRPPKTEFVEVQEFTYAQMAEELPLTDDSDDFFGAEGTQTVFDMDDIDAILEPESDSGPEETTRKGKSKKKKQQALEFETGDHYLSDSSLSSESTTSTASDWDVGDVPTVSEEPYVPLSYQVPPRALARWESAHEAHHGKVFWSHTWYEDQNGKNIEVVVCDTFEKCENTAKRLLKDEVLGFDLEWFIKPSQIPWRNVALIQLASENLIALFQLAAIKKEKISELLAPTLRHILESKDILKVGVAIAGDGSRIRRWLDVNPQSLLELSALHCVNENYKARRKNAKISQRPIALSTLCEIYLKFPLFKGAVRVSDWTRTLTSDQVNYAATDAYAGIRIYDCLQQIRKSFNPVPPMPPCVNAPVMTNKQKRRGTISAELALKLPGLDGPKQKAALYKQDGIQSTSFEEFASPEASKPRKKPVRRLQVSSAEMEMAMEWGKKYLLEHPDTEFSSSHLKAYALWHYGEHTVEDIIGSWRASAGHIAKLVHEVVTDPSITMPYKEERYHREISLHLAQSRR